MREWINMDKYSVIDLFAGAGGLSLGFMQTQKYDIKVAFENNKNMQETYRRNHPTVDVQGDVCSADYAAIREKYGEIDIVIGGPLVRASLMQTGRKIMQSAKIICS